MCGILSFPNRLSNCEIWSSSPRETEREHSMWARTGTRAGSRGAFATQAGPGTGGPNTITRSRVPIIQQWALKLSPRFIRTIERLGAFQYPQKTNNIKRERSTCSTLRTTMPVPCHSVSGLGVVFKVPAGMGCKALSEAPADANSGPGCLNHGGLPHGPLAPS
jgi:hypothetical protein